MRIRRTKITRLALGLVTLLGAATLLGAVAPVMAAPGDADELRATLQTLIDMQKRSQAASGGALQLDGEMRIAPAPGGFAVTLPKIDIRSRTGGRVSIGAITLTAHPSTTTHGWDVAVTFPPRIQSFDADGKAGTEFTMKSQAFRGVLNADLKEFTAITATFGGIGIRSPGKTGTGSIDTIQFELDLKPDASDRWSGPGKGTISGIRFADPRDKSSFTVGTLTLSSNALECNSAAMREMTMTALESRPTATGAGNPGALWSGFLGMIRQCRSMAFDYTLKDLSFTSPRKNNPKEMMNVGIREAGFGGEVTTSGADSLLDGAFHYRVAGLSGIAELDTTGSPLMQEFFPRDTTFDLRYRNIDAGRWTPAGADSASPGTGGVKNAILGPGAIYDIRDLTLLAPGYEAHLVGVMTGDAQVPLGLQLDMTLTCAGLDESLTRLRSMASNPGLYKAKEKDLTSAIQSLMVLQLMGTQGTAANGRSLRTYHVVVDEQGQVLLNGTDMKSFMEMIGGSKSDDGE